MRLRRLDQLGREELDRAARAVEGARAAGAVAYDAQIRVAFVHADALVEMAIGEAQSLAKDARERGFVTLARRLRHGVHVQIAVLVEARVRLVLGREARRAALEESRDAEAAQFPLALRSLAPSGEAAPVGKPQRLVHHALEFAAIVGVAVR